MKFVDDKNKKLSWYSRNYLFLGTLTIITLNILLFALLGNYFTDGIGGQHIWYGKLDLSNIFRVFLNAFEHSNWQHVLLNMLCFSFCGLYIERKTGTFNFLLLVLGLTFIEGAFSAAGSYSVEFHGASGLVYICYAYILIDYIFSFHKYKRNKTNTILGAIIIALMYLAMCFDGGTDGFSFKPYPYDLLSNLGHYSAFFAGIIVSLIIQVVQLKYLNNSTPVEFEPKKVSKKIYILPIILICMLSICCPILSIVANNRTNIDYSITFDCNYDQFDTTLEYNYSDNKYSSLQSTFLPNFRSTFEADKRYGYCFEIYEDKGYKKRIEYNAPPLYRPLYSGMDFIPLARATKKTYYLKMFEGYEVYIAYHYLKTYFQDDQIISDNYNDNIFSLYQSKGAKTLIVEKNKNCSFKLPYIRPNYDLQNLIVKANGEQLSLDENGYYTIENVTENIQITFSYI